MFISLSDSAVYFLCGCFFIIISIILPWLVAENLRSSAGVARANRSVSIYVDSVRVYHWTRGVSAPVKVDKDAPELFKAFAGRCREAFGEEIGTGAFSLYEMPADYKLIEERKKITTSTQLVKVFQAMECFGKTPAIFIFNVQEQTKSPDKTQCMRSADDGASSDATSVMSIDTEASRGCRITADHSCAFCGFASTAKSTVQAAHLYELQDFKKVPKKERYNELRKKGISHIHDQRNMLCLCSVCHDLFNGPSFSLGINPKTKKLAVGSAVRALPVNGRVGEVLAGLAGSAVKFSGPREWHPPLKLLTYRYSYYRDGEATDVEHVAVTGAQVSKGSAKKRNKK